MDDLISGGDSIKEATEIRQQVKQLLARGLFPIRKWCISNESAALEGESETDCEKLMQFHDGTSIAKALGLAWDPASDFLLFNFNDIIPNGPTTKRSVLSTLAKFYDPLGLISPIITRMKVFMQPLWKENIDWDESLPQHLHSAWTEITSQLSFVHSLKFPRFIMAPAGKYEIHGFCDASIAAYGACIYV